MRSFALGVTGAVLGILLPWVFGVSLSSPRQTAFGLTLSLLFLYAESFRKP